MLRVVAVVALIAALGAACATAGSKTPAMRLTEAKPAKIHGVRFAAAERIRLRVRTDGRTLVRRVHANARGSFVTALGGSYDPCSSALLVRARGSAGSIALLKVPQRQCPPA